MASSGSRMLTAGVADDARRPNGRASSLIRMWRELEAEAGAGLASNHFAETAVDAVASDGSGWMDGLGDWSSDAMAMASSEIDQGPVGDNAIKAGRLPAVEGSESQSFTARMEQDRRRELAALVDRGSVSGFAHRGRLQSMIKLRSLERQAAVLDRMQCFPSRMDSDRPYNQSTFSFLRGSGSNPILEVQSPTGNGDISTNASNAADALLPVDAECSSCPCSTEQCDGSGVSNSCRRRPPAGSSPQSIGRHSENFTTDNVEIRELLDRRRVSTSLASDFGDKMNKLILSFLQRRRRRAGNFCSDTDFAEHQNSEQVDSVSSSLEREAMQELRSEMARIREEIRALRQMVESCMEWQGRLEQTIK